VLACSEGVVALSTLSSAWVLRFHTRAGMAQDLKLTLGDHNHNLVVPCCLPMLSTACTPTCQ
jgi:hypothetical protein